MRSLHLAVSDLPFFLSAVRFIPPVVVYGTSSRIPGHVHKTPCAGQIRHSRGGGANRYSRLSYLLYTLGWTLGLIGRLYGVEGVAGTE